MSEERAEYRTDGVPEGYMRDGQGRLVPRENIREIDLVQDELVRDLFGVIEEKSREIGKLKAAMLCEIEAFLELSAEKYGVKRGGAKGNVSLVSFDQTRRILRAMEEKITFGPELQAARALIEECVEDWTDGARSELKTVVHEVFREDAQGKLSTSKVLGLRRWNIDDLRWQRAMEAIADSVQVVGRATYVRAYRRTGVDESWQQVPLG